MHTDSVGKVFVAGLPANSFFLGGRIMKEAEIWQQEHHEVILQTAVRTEIWRGKVNGGEEEVLKWRIHGRKTKQNKKRNSFLSEWLSTVYFKAEKLCCGLYVGYSSQAKEKQLSGLQGKAPSPLRAVWKQGTRGCSASYLHLARYSHIQQGKDSSCCCSYGVQVTVFVNLTASSGMAPKCLVLVFWSPYVFRLEPTVPLFLDRDFLFRKKPWLAILAIWAEGINVFIKYFLDNLKSRGKSEEMDWRTANLI